MKTYFYVDAFNLYYGAVKGTRYRWLNLYELFSKLFPKAQIVRIKYFTARVTAHPSDPDKPVRQQLLLRAFATIPCLEVIEGHFLSHQVVMPLVRPTSHDKYAKVIKTEEKGSDVNLASHLLLDGFTSAFEQAIVVSGDSDLATPIEMVRSHLNKPVGVLLPQLLSGSNTKNRRRSAKLQAVASFYREGIREGVLKASQFPDAMTDKHGQFGKPAAW
jgi:NYN domain